MKRGPSGREARCKRRKGVEKSQVAAAVTDERNRASVAPELQRPELILSVDCRQLLGSDRGTIWPLLVLHLLLTLFLFLFLLFLACAEQYWDPPVQHLWGTYTNPIEAA